MAARKETKIMTSPLVTFFFSSSSRARLTYPELLEHACLEQLAHIDEAGNLIVGVLLGGQQVQALLFRLQAQASK